MTTPPFVTVKQWLQQQEIKYPARHTPSECTYWRLSCIRFTWIIIFHCMVVGSCVDRVETWCTHMYTNLGHCITERYTQVQARNRTSTTNYYVHINECHVIKFNDWWKGDQNGKTRRRHTNVSSSPWKLESERRGCSLLVRGSSKNELWGPPYTIILWLGG